MSDQEVIERTWQAPIDVVWDLWTSAEGIASWFGPRGFTVVVDEIDLTVGGAFQYTMTSSEAGAQPRVVMSTITELEPPRKLVYESPMGGSDVMTTSAEFTETADGVKLVLVISATVDGMVKGAAMGWESSLERFGEQIA